MLLFPKVLEERNSPINGKIQVVSQLGKIAIKAQGLTQSGGVGEVVLKTGFERIKNEKTKIDDFLILGLGGGSAARLASELWPRVKITGVDIDPIMIELGKKYMDLDKIPNLKVLIADAARLDKIANFNKGEAFDLILVDIYKGDKVPEEAESEKFIKMVKMFLKPGGIAIFNRLFYNDKKETALDLREKLNRYFSSITAIYPEANILFICRENTV